MSLILFAHIFLVVVHTIAENETQFIYNGFNGSINKLDVDGVATILPNGLLRLTNHKSQDLSHAFYPKPVIFKPNPTSFSTTFVFAIYPLVLNHSSYGISFVISPTKDFRHAKPGPYLGIFNASTTNLGSKDYTNQSLNHIFAVELDTLQSSKANYQHNNHVGLDVNSLNSKDAAPALYYSDKQGVNKSLQLNSGKAMTVWIDYDELDMIVNVTLAPLGEPKPSKHLLAKHLNLSSVLLDSMYVGFSSSTSMIGNSHYILGWSWNQSGKAQDLDPLKLPSLPPIKHQKFNLLRHPIFVALLTVFLILLLLIAGAVWFVWTKKYEEVLEPWEKEHAPQRFSYKDLYKATRGFRKSEILGVGGFGKVYKGVLPSTGDQVAVKRVSHDSKQGIKEFIAEVSSMRRLRHRNLVQLLGYCRRKGELLLVYDYMPNGSLDKFLFDQAGRSSLCWSSRFNIIKGVASALLYLHEEWEQVVLHRDVKASNVLLDADMNARLGDFGLARLYDHDIDPRTTHVVGTIGYMAPEMNITLKPTTNSDVFAYGMFLLEVGCGRRPVGRQADYEDEEFLSDWVCECWKKGEILKTADPKLNGNYQEEEIELVLKLGLLCLHPKPEERPTMRQVVQFLNGSVALPGIPSEYDIQSLGFIGRDWEALSSSASQLPPSSSIVSIAVISSTDSALHYGR